MADISGKIRNENIRKFLATVEKDQELQKKFSRFRSPEEAYALAASIQGGFTKEEFVTEMQGLYEDLTKDLTDEDMLKVAGGEYMSNSEIDSSLFGYTNVAAV